MQKKLKNYFCSFKFYGVRNNEKWSCEKQNKGTILPWGGQNTFSINVLFRSKKIYSMSAAGHSQNP